ncbi:DNA replication complex subunit Gins51 [Palaeococcus ferrophilus]|uniref:DNA replication complex subunit Gins51 n=1 Tax=Palaeococcus ferrophilus TaxID=83868 RepID=UPI000AFFFF99
MGLDIIQLRELLERELGSTELEPLDEGFYREFEALEKALKFKAEGAGERGEDVEERLALAELKIAEKLVREIIRTRLHKIVDLAVRGVPAPMTPEERRVFSLLVAFINREELPSGVPEEVHVEETMEESVEVKRTIREAYIIEADIPRIFDEELNEHGPFREGDMVVLPRSLASVLEERGVARRVRIE